MPRPLLLLFCCLLTSLSLGACRRGEAPKGKPPVPVLTATALQRDVPLVLTAVGNVEPQATVTVKSQVTGSIARVHFREGGEVAKGSLLFTIDPRSFQAAVLQAEGALARSQAQHRIAVEQARRYESLLKDGIVAQDQADQYRAVADALAATVTADRAALEQARVQLSYCSIKSPIAGRTGNLAIQEGNLVKASDVTLVTINQLAPINVSFALPERELARVRERLAQGRLGVLADTGDGRPAAEGVLEFLDNAVDPATGTIRLKGVFANGDRRLWPGQFVTARLKLGNVAGAVTVPNAAVQTGQQGSYLFVVDKDGVADIRPVKTGVSSDGVTVIDSGLQAGETVVVDGQSRLYPKAKVQLRDAAPAKGAAPAPAPAGAPVPAPAPAGAPAAK